MQRKQVYLTEGQIETINKESRSSGLSFSELLRRIIDKALSSKGSK